MTFFAIQSIGLQKMVLFSQFFELNSRPAAASGND